MADETKKYLINIESNLKKYIDELIEAKKKLDDAKLAVENLQKGQFKSREEIEKVNAAYRNAKKEVSDATKLVNLATQANKAQSGSYEQLYRNHQLLQTALKLEGGMMVKNIDGTYKMTDKYIRLSKEVDNAKKGIDQFGKGISDNRLNVGNYGEAVSSAFKSAGQSILSMISPLALITAGIALAKKVFEGFKEAIISTTGVINAMNIVGAITKQMFYDVAINGRLSVESMRQVAAAAAELNKLRTEEYKDTFEISKINREEQAVRELSIDRTRTHTQRLEDLNKVTELENQKTKIKVGHLQAELEANIKIMEQRPKDEKQRQKVWELMTKINDAYAEEDQAMRRVNTQRTGFIQEEIDQRKKQFDAYMVEIEKTNEAIDKAEQEKIKQAEERLKKLKTENDDFAKFSLGLINEEIKSVSIRKKLKIDDLKFNQNIADKNAALIEDAKRLSDWETDQYIRNQDLKREAAVAGLSAISSILGEQTEIGKGFAVAAATIDTWGAANKVLNDPTIPSTWLRIAMMATIILTGLANVKNILSVKIGKSSTSPVSAPTSISSSIPAQKSFATPVGSTILTQPQLSQTQLNALPQSILTADDIANAMSRIPPPIVTVEDIDRVSNNKKKVSVRANI
jgi:chromosome segregation ATPase